VNLAYGGEANIGGVYHSAYDTNEYYTRIADPGLRYSHALAQTAGRVVLRFADSPVPPQRYGDFADTVSGYLTEVKKLADSKRDAAEMQAKMLESGAFRLADDPNRTSGMPQALKPVPHFNFAPLENAVDRLKKSAKAYDAALSAHGSSLPAQTTSQLFDLTRETEKTLAPDTGLPGRNWYKNLMYAPGAYTGYSAKTLPGVREAVEEERWADADRYVAITAAALQNYADKLDQAVKLMNAPNATAAR
jgi:N-acetylated-alpha-linked acidic dipeptidase